MADEPWRELLDKQACVELVYRLARAIDRCDEELVREVFHDDATDDHGVFHGTAADFADWVMPVLHGMRRTQHLIGNVLIEVSGDTARGESYFNAHHALPQPDGTDVHMIAAGRYLDRFERRNGEWKIAHRQAVYDWNAAAPSTDSWKRGEQPGWRFGERAPGDYSYEHFANG